MAPDLTARKWAIHLFIGRTLHFESHSIAIGERRQKNAHRCVSSPRDGATWRTCRQNKTNIAAGGVNLAIDKLLATPIPVAVVPLSRLFGMPADRGPLGNFLPSGRAGWFPLSDWTMHLSAAQTAKPPAHEPRRYTAHWRTTAHARPWLLGYR